MIELHFPAMVLLVCAVVVRVVPATLTAIQSVFDEDALKVRVPVPPLNHVSKIIIYCLSSQNWNSTSSTQKISCCCNSDRGCHWYGDSERICVYCLWSGQMTICCSNDNVSNTLCCFCCSIVCCEGEEV